VHYELEFWEKGTANLVRNYLIMTKVSAVGIPDERYVANILPAATNLPLGDHYDPIFGASEIEVKDRAIAVICARPENAGLRSFLK
jgi:hypothetical protein